MILSRAGRLSVFIMVICCACLLAHTCIAAEEDPLRAALKSAEAASKDGYINFNFDQVDVRAFVKLAGEITGRKFIVGDDVEGKITVVSPQISRKEAYPLFVSILESVGCSVIEEEGVYRVVKLTPRPTHMAPVVGVGEKMPSEGVVTKVIHLKYVSAADLCKVLESKVGGGKEGAIAAIEETNHLLITDTAESIRRIEKIILEVDQPGLSHSTEIVSLQYADASDMAEQLNIAVAEGESRAEELRKRLPSAQGSSYREKRGVLVVAAPHANSLILVGTQSQISELKRIISVMDVDTPSGRGRLNAIFLKYISAEEAAKSINALLTKSADGKKDASDGQRGIAIEANAVNNALLVDASPSDFEIMKKLIDQLDCVQEQVHIEVIIAEMSISDSLNLGVEMAALQMPSDAGSTVVQGSSTLGDDANNLMNVIQNGIFPRGLSVGVAYGTRVDSQGKVITSYPGLINIDAVKKNSHVNIRSQTSLEAQNNKEATVSIVNEIPILKSTIQGGSGTARDVIQNIDRVDVGIKLKLTPHIVANREIQMVLNPSIEAVIDQGPSATQFAPTIAKREVSTTVTVPNGRTIIIAGLTREDKKKIVKRVPFLGSIPLLGIFFRNTVDGTEKTNVLIFVTPHIVSNLAEAEKVMESWENKTGIKSE